MPFGIYRLRNLFRHYGPRDAVAHLAAVTRGETDYKTTWNSEASRGAHEAILTGSTAESFEEAGRIDADMLARFLRGGDKVLNIGCGVGRVEKYLAPRVAEMWAVDISGEMIRLAGRRLADLPNVRLREVGNREFLSAFPDGEFDLVFSLLVLQHVEREDAFLYLRDARRVLKSGGRVVTQFPNFLTEPYTHAFVQGAEDPERSRGRVRPYTEAEVRHMLSIAGLRVDELWAGGHHGPAEIYVAATKV